MNRPKIDFTLISEGAPFYALEVTSERRASDDLFDLHLECWAFTFRRFRPGARWNLRMAGGKERFAERPHSEYRAPMFPGYVFARIPDDMFPAVLALPRVMDVVRGASNEPRQVPEDMIAEMVLDVAACRWDEDLPTPSKGSTRHAGGLIIPVNKARSRARRKRVTTRLRKWLDESEGQGLARAA
jgi:transcription antitermination factor NusG